MKKVIAAVTTLGFVLVAGQAYAESAAKDFVGQTVRAISPDGNIMVINYSADGKSAINVNNGGFTDTGVYKVTDTGYCATWTKIHDGKEGCYLVVKDGNVYLIANGKTGEVAARGTIPPKS
ncbi:MAG: hypothetical protein HKN28_07585 [Alphaproteobacteria bacterium]|nr:hypothetical protein [Alphaproteobacteria bacterium]